MRRGPPGNAVLQQQQQHSAERMFQEKREKSFESGSSASTWFRLPCKRPEIQQREHVPFLSAC